MTYSLTWLPQVLEEAGLKVAQVPGWGARGRGEMGRVLGVMLHHTAGPKVGNMPSLKTLTDGRADLPGPLAQLGLGRDGTWYVVAAGRCNHAGTGEWQGITTGNSSFIGIEAENAGTPDDLPWPSVQLDACRRGIAAILAHIGLASDACIGHKEYALPKGRKSDPNLDMPSLRKQIADVMSGAAGAVQLIPTVEPAPPGASVGRPTLRRGAIDELVKQIQAKCGLEQDGAFGAKTEAAVRELQRKHDMVPDGIVGPKTWALVDKL